MTDYSPLALAIAARHPKLRAKFAAAADAYNSPRTLEAVLTDMERVARHAYERNGIATEDDLRRAGWSMNGLVEEPMVAGMARAFDDALIDLFARDLFEGLRRARKERIAQRGVEHRHATDAAAHALQAASLFLVALIGSAALMAGVGMLLRSGGAA